MLQFFRRLLGPVDAEPAPAGNRRAASPEARPARSGSTDVRAPVPPIHTDAPLPADFWQIDERTVICPPDGFGYELALDMFFNARHFVIMGGTAGPVHRHFYRVQIRCWAPRLMYTDQVVISYHVLRERLHLVVSAYNDRLLNDLPVFQRLQPTTENLTAMIFQQLARLFADLPLELMSVTIWESPTEMVTYGRATRSVTLELSRLSSNDSVLQTL